MLSSFVWLVIAMVFMYAKNFINSNSFSNLSSLLFEHSFTPIWLQFGNKCIICSWLFVNYTQLFWGQNNEGRLINFFCVDCLSRKNFDTQLMLYAFILSHQSWFSNICKINWYVYKAVINYPLKAWMATFKTFYWWLC